MRRYYTEVGFVAMCKDRVVKFYKVKKNFANKVLGPVARKHSSKQSKSLLLVSPAVCTHWPGARIKPGKSFPFTLRLNSNWYLAILPPFKKIGVLQKNQLLLLSIFSGILLVLAWPTSPLTLLIFVAWVPLLYIAEVEKKVGRFFLYSLLSMFIWNAGTTWWIWNATPAGAVGAIVINSFFMSIPLWGFYIIKQKYTKTAAVLSFVAFWLCFEYVHLTWQLSWPWLTLGNVFAMHTNWIQWYEYTGVSGGSLWVLVVNVAIAHLIIFYKTGAKATLFATAILALAVPFVVSGLVNPKKNASTTTGKNDYNVVVVQPNIDPYSEKFDPASTSEQLKKLIKLSEEPPILKPPWFFGPKLLCLYLFGKTRLNKKQSTSQYLIL